MSERIPCVREGCDHMILPATAAKTGGYCMPCKQEMEREAHRRYIEANRRDVDLYEGITDTIQILKIMHEPRTHDPLIRYVPYKYAMEQVYLFLTAEQQYEMKQYAMDLIRSDDEDTGKDILLYLVCYHDLPLTAEIPELLEREIVYPAVLFKSASDETRDHLLQRVNNDGENRNHILMMLAYIGDDVVVQQFWHWKQSPPPWASELYVAPEHYALQAGWELTSDGQRRELFITPSYSLYEVRHGEAGESESGWKTGNEDELNSADNEHLSKVNEMALSSVNHQEIQGKGAASKSDNMEDEQQREQGQRKVKQGFASVKGDPVSLLMPSSHHCPWCGSPFISLMNLHVKHPALLSVYWEFPQLDVQTCLVCSSYRVVYMKMDAAGKPIWSEHNVKPDGFDEIDVEEIKDDVSRLVSSTLDDSEEKRGQMQRRLFRIASKPRQPFHGSEWAMEPSLSQIGGHPGWVQDADYPACPACSTTMKTIGQLDGELIQENGEGVYYMFVCEPCQMTAVSYQQS